MSLRACRFGRPRVHYQGNDESVGYVSYILFRQGGYVPVQSQHLAEDENEHHGHENFGLVDVCTYALEG